MENKMITGIFAYGTLKHNIDPPKTLKNWLPASVKADCYDSPNHEYPLALNFGHSSNTLNGEILIIDDSELPSIDKREDHRDYERDKIDVNTKIGILEVWVYVWHNKIPFGAKLISNWEP